MRTRSRFWFAVVACVVTVPWLAVTGADVAAARVFLKAADCLFKEWRYRDALAMYARAEQTGDPAERVEAALGIAASAVRLGEFEVAYTTASRLKNAEANHAGVFTAFGEAAWGNGLFDEAEGAFREALTRRPADPRARLGFARVLLARGLPDEALEHSLAAMASGTDDADAPYLSGLVYERLRKPDLAARSYAKYLALAPAATIDKRNWVAAQIQLLRSFDRRIPGRVENDGPASIHTVPFRLRNDKVVVQARLNGGHAVDFELDTGAETTVLSQATAARAGAATLANTLSAGIGDEGLRGLGNARLDSMQVGTLVIHDVPCLVNRPTKKGSAAEPDAFSPLAAGLSVRVDYQRKRLTIARELPGDGYDVEVPLWFYRLATVSGSLDNGRAGRFIVDTGARAISVANDTAQTLPARPGVRRIPVPVFGLSGRDRDAYLLLGADVAVGPVTLTRVPVIVLDLHTAGERLGYRIRGIVGQQFLSKYRVSIDLKRRVVGLNDAGR